MKPRSIEVHIEELVLYGFAPSDRYRIAETLERELTSLLTEHTPRLISLENNLGQLDGDSIDLGPGSKPDVIGIHVARAVYEGLSDER